MCHSLYEEHVGLILGLIFSVFFSLQVIDVYLPSFAVYTLSVLLPNKI